MGRINITNYAISPQTFIINILNYTKNISKEIIPKQKTKTTHNRIYEKLSKFNINKLTK